MTGLFFFLLSMGGLIWLLITFAYAYRAHDLLYRYDPDDVETNKEFLLAPLWPVMLVVHVVKDIKHAIAVVRKAREAKKGEGEVQ